MCNVIFTHLNDIWLTSPQPSTEIVLGKVSNKGFTVTSKIVFSALILWSLKNLEGVLKTFLPQLPSHSPSLVFFPL